MELESFSLEPKRENKLAQVSAYSAGIGWALLFGFIFSDQILTMVLDGGGDGLSLCVAPLFILAMAGLLIGILTGLIALSQLQKTLEQGEQDAKNGIRYGLGGISFVVIAPILNTILEEFGLHIFTILDFFGSWR